MNNDLFQKIKLIFITDLISLDSHAKENKALTWQKSLTITYPTHINPIFGKEEDLSCPNVIIRPTIDYSKTCIKRPLKKKTKHWFSRPIIA